MPTADGHDREPSDTTSAPNTTQSSIRAVGSSEPKAPQDDRIPPTASWDGDAVVLVDQRALPGRLRMLRVQTSTAMCDAIRSMAVRGAPALGVAGAFGVALAHRAGEDREQAAACLVGTRPTAVNLARGVERAVAAADPLAEALLMIDEDIDRNHRIGAHGGALVPEGARIMTHCNAGALACAGYGTAVGVVRNAHDAGRVESVWVRETRPVLQGSRLTAWELDRLGVPATLIVDAAAAALMAAGMVDCCIVGADRIAANGDVANKVGTYELAVLARYHDVPFLVAAPVDTVDLSCPSGGAIPIEQRDPAEVRGVAGQPTSPPGQAVWNPAFDVTPAALVTAIITEHGVAAPPLAPALAAACAGRSLP